MFAFVIPPRLLLSMYLPDVDDVHRLSVKATVTIYTAASFRVAVWPVSIWHRISATILSQLLIKLPI
jgi:hypothetical protein